eukprot:SAG31_NODE_4702_length_3022_cov_6.121108_5_plen_148_part_00
MKSESRLARKHDAHRIRKINDVGLVASSCTVPMLSDDAGDGTVAGAPAKQQGELQSRSVTEAAHSGDIAMLHDRSSVFREEAHSIGNRNSTQPGHCKNASSHPEEVKTKNIYPASTQHRKSRQKRQVAGCARYDFCYRFSRFVAMIH